MRGMSAGPHLQDVVRILATETAGGQPGSRAVATRLTEVLFVLAIRAWIERADTATETGPSWLTALRDPRIGTSLSLMHEEPHRDWTVESLARTVTMSRPAFARRFKEVVGHTPLAYLAPRARADRPGRPAAARHRQSGRRHRASRWIPLRVRLLAGVLPGTGHRARPLPGFIRSAPVLTPGVKRI
ncbi:AraC-like DNA-binding protein [Streptomyces sp. V4I2]|nr:cupin domain-containing protein [Streptomyces sp. V4I2]MDQ1043641.1 AraC-like DNA-binding protein [Streptomyces sp. V4I2]